MKVGLFLNLPSETRLMRRYMCSYNSPTFLFQPIELLCLAGIYREWKNGEPLLLDAVAEEKDLNDVLEYIKVHQPEFIITLSGFECFEEDMNTITEIKESFPDIPIILFGHYATQFPEIIMEKIPVDYIIHGEPDMIFSDLLDAIQNKKALSEIHGLSYKLNDEIFHQKGHSRIPNPNELPLPAFDLLQNHLYSEPFFPKPYGLIQSARGCPYQCNYCVKSFGTKLTALSPENIILQVETYIELFKIESFRFIDDTFTAVPSRVISFCKLMIEKNYQHLKWSCLSRPDTLDREMLQWMKKAGCVRIYIGMESGSKDVLDFYNKRIDLEQALSDLQFAKSLGFELMGFFMVGAPIEMRKEVNESINFAIKAGFDFIVIGKLITYPGTSLFDKMQKEVNFSLLPYINEFQNIEQEKNAIKLQKYFYRKFYFNPRILIKIIKGKIKFIFNEFGINIKSFFSYLLTTKDARKRKDYV